VLSDIAVLALQRKYARRRLLGRPLLFPAMGRCQAVKCRLRRPAGESRRVRYCRYGGDVFSRYRTSAKIPPIKSTTGISNIVTSRRSIPEPSTWAMMLLGFARLGFAGYRASGDWLSSAFQPSPQTLACQDCYQLHRSIGRLVFPAPVA
jgi:hypothetical protein